MALAFPPHPFPRRRHAPNRFEADAPDLASGPLAWMIIPFRVPRGFHCTYHAADSALYGQALTSDRIIH